MKPEELIGMRLDDARDRLRATGDKDYEIRISRAPRRPTGVGALHVLKVDESKKEITVCAFITDIAEKV